MAGLWDGQYYMHILLIGSKMTTYCSWKADCVYYRTQLNHEDMDYIGNIVKQSAHETVFIQAFLPDDLLVEWYHIIGSIKYNTLHILHSSDYIVFNVSCFLCVIMVVVVGVVAAIVSVIVVAVVLVVVVLAIVVSSSISSRSSNSSSSIN